MMVEVVDVDLSRDANECGAMDTLVVPENEARESDSRGDEDQGG